MYKFGKRSNERREGVNELLIECSDRALAISKWDMTIPWMGGIRTAEDQNKIFKEGNSKMDGFEKKSYHQSGNAIDIIPVQGGYANDKAFRHFAACMFHAWQTMFYMGLAREYHLEYGGHWQNFYDAPHWQIVKRI